MSMSSLTASSSSLADIDLLSPSLSKKDRVRRLRELMKQEEQEQLEQLQKDFTPEALLWLALAPGWTVPAADRCDYPGAYRNAGSLFSNMAERGIAQAWTRPTSEGEGVSHSDPFYVMASHVRSTLLEAYQTSGDDESMNNPGGAVTPYPRWKDAGAPSGPPSTLPELRQMVSRMGKALLKADDDGVVPPKLARWADLAKEADTGTRLASYLDRQTAKAYRNKEPVDAAREIHDDMEAVKPLAWLIEQDEEKYELDLALQRSARRLELLQRRKRDQQHLKHFFTRSEQIQAFMDLMSGPDSLWALHLAGAGGVGKTMLIRYITAELTGEATSDAVTEKAARNWPAVERLTEVAVARIDFDYLNADFPKRAPGLLLWSFGQELRAYDEGRGYATRCFDQADNLLDVLHAKLRAGARGAIQWQTQRSEFVEATQLYIEGIVALKRRVLLILDTCEELAKVTAGGPHIHLEETFRILRALHDGAATLIDGASGAPGFPGLRVILSGRRPLAHAGYRWICPTSNFPGRPFLRVHELRGFDHEEARTFLQDHGVTDEKLVDAVITRSTPDAGPPFSIEYADAERAPRQHSRCNPYDLKLFFDWAREEPPPSLDTILSAGGDQYVELRIVSRIKDNELEAVLPIVSLMVHVDKEMLRVACSLDEKATQDVFRKLEEFEWTELRRVAPITSDENRIVLSVKGGVRDRLACYFQRRGSVSPKMRRLAAQHADFITSTRPLSQLEWTDFDAGLRVFEGQPTASVTWWLRIEARLFAQGGAERTTQVLELLLGADGAVTERMPAAGPEQPPENLLRPFVMATHACALMHAGITDTALAIWREVASRASKRDGPLHAALARRAAAGAFVAAVSAREPVRHDMLQGLFAAFQSECGGNEMCEPDRVEIWTAACEALVELTERLAATDPQALSDLMLDRLTPRMCLDFHARVSETVNTKRESQIVWSVRAFIASVAARAALHGESPALASELFDDALELLGQGEAEPPTPVDWVAPACVGERVRLEFLCHVTGRFMGPSDALEALRLRAPMSVQSETIDGDRLQSKMLQLGLADGVPDTGFVDLRDRRPRLPKIATDESPYRCNAHQRTPPLAIATYLCVATEAIEATLDGLEAILEEADDYNTELVRHVARLVVRLVINLRLGDERRGLRAQTVLVDSADPLDEVLLRLKSVYEGLRPDILSEDDVLDAPAALGLCNARFPELAAARRNTSVHIESLRRLHGKRTAAQITQIMGELAPLIKWRNASLLLKISNKLYEQCDDVFGAFRAAILLFLARAHDIGPGANRVSLRRKLRDVERAYTVVAGAWKSRELPSWDFLRWQDSLQMPDPTDAQSQLDSFPAIARPWITRVLLCVYLERHLSEEGIIDTTTSSFGRLLVRRFGATLEISANTSSRDVPERVALPFEPGHWINPPRIVRETVDAAAMKEIASVRTERLASPQPPPIAQDALFGRPWEILRSIGEGLTRPPKITPARVLVLPLALAATSYTIFAPAAGASHLLGWGLATFAMSLLTALSLYLRGVLSALNALGTAHVRLNLYVRGVLSGAEPGTADSERFGRPLSMSLDIRGRELAAYPWVLLKPSVSRSLEFTVNSTGESADIRVMSKNGDEALNAKSYLEQVLSRLDSRMLAVRIQAPRELQSHPIEHDFLQVLNREFHLRVGAHRLACLRLQPTASPLKSHAEPLNRVIVLGGMASPMRRRDFLASFQLSDRRRIVFGREEQVDPEVSAVILDGEFQMSSVGARFRLAQNAASTKIGRADDRDASAEAISAERLTDFFPRAGAYILHYGVREVDSGTRLGRRQASLAREFACDLCSKGVSFVVVLPQRKPDDLHALLKALPRLPATQLGDFFTVFSKVNAGRDTRDRSLAPNLIDADPETSLFLSVPETDSL